MKRIEFIKTSSALVAGSFLSPLISCEQPAKEVRRNWAGNYADKADHLEEPKTVEAVQTLVRQPGAKKALGSKHCFNNIAAVFSGYVVEWENDGRAHFLGVIRKFYIAVSL